MTGPSLPPAEPTGTPTASAPSDASGHTAFDSVATERALPSPRPVTVRGPLGRLSVGGVVLSAVGVIVLLFVARGIFHTDPVTGMTSELKAVQEAEAVYHGAHNEYTASLPALQAVSKVKLSAHLVQFSAGKNGYQVTLRNAGTDKQCSITAGSFMAIGGDPAITCEDVPTPK